MKSIFIGLITLFALSASADSITQNWKWGIGFDSVANMKSSATLEVMTPKLFGEEREWSIVFSLSSQQLNYNILNEDLDVIPLRVMLESRNPVYKDLVSSYVRLGVGYSFASDKFIHKDDGYFIIPVVIGVDVISIERNGHHGSFYAQVSYDTNFAKASDGLANDLDGTIVSMGVRIFY